jgi:nucleoid-associated protein YgaU
MKRIASMLIGALFVGASFGVAMAQEGAAPPANPPAAAPAAAAPAAPAAAPTAAADEHADEVAAFHRVLKMHHRMWRRLKQNPALVKDTAFVGKYNDLQLFFNKYEGSKDRFLADPGLYLKMSEKKAMHREETRSPGEE